MAKTNKDVLFQYRGVNVRACNRVTLKLGVVDFKRLLDEVAKNEKLSIHKVIAYSLRPCSKCSPVIPTNEVDPSGEAVVINRVCLSVPQSNGINIFKHSKLLDSDGSDN